MPTPSTRWAAPTLSKRRPNQMEAQAYDYFRRIEELGGVLPAIEKGFFQSEISDAAYRYQREIDEGQRRIVGVNAYAGR